VVAHLLSVIWEVVEVMVVMVVAVTSEKAKVMTLNVALTMWYVAISIYFIQFFISLQASLFNCFK
jgi:hypothetical protein